jgi:hypothetical protein
MKISYPQQITYFICKNDENITGYGEITPEQEMTTGQPIVDTYLDKGQWEAKLLEGGITLEQETLEQEQLN